MQQYLRKARFSTAADDLGLRLLIFLLADTWFLYLWGLTVPALLAGTALGILGQMCLTRFRRHTVDRREAALRSRLGGEMFLEELLLAPAKQVHFQTALLLGERYPLVMERVTDSGVLCQSGGERLLVTGIALPDGSEVSMGQLLACQRACRELEAQRGVACVTGRCSAKTEAWAEGGAVPLKIIRRDMLLQLAGQMCPATDAQLVALGQRRKRSVPAGGVWRMIFRQDKAKRYMGYGLALMAMYLVTGLKYYPLPGILCMVLASACRCVKKGRDVL